MYAWIWRHLPGGRGLRLLQALLLFIGFVVLAFMVIFPALSSVWPHNRDVIG